MRVPGMAFFTKFNLVYLERMHNVEPYHCYQCGKAFTNDGYLTSHKRKHNEDKPFQCIQCDESLL